jgi:hypothetical protein
MFGGLVFLCWDIFSSLNFQKKMNRFRVKVFDEILIHARKALQSWAFAHCVQLGPALKRLAFLSREFGFELHTVPIFSSNFN